VSILLSTAALHQPFPRDPHLLTALGKLAVAHTHLELVLRYTRKTLTGQSVAAALDATHKMRTSRVRGHIKQLFNAKQPTAEEVRQLDTLMSDAEKLTEIRNGYLHVAWSETAEGKTIRRTRNHRWGPAPSPQEVQQVTNQILLLMTTLNEARKNGFIAEVVKRHNKISFAPNPPV
jgi:hypothetical protein